MASNARTHTYTATPKSVAYMEALADRLDVFDINDTVEAMRYPDSDKE